ncbi:DUF5706 domain-containing protein [Priestia megaterium]|uniref:Pycsar system effector family protein n=1 Tax=Priestia megaterium TaxID=1404 RepID=UPI0021AD0E57|nr:Pycsar system effector family protein [Priestia megaterium]MCR8927453.1 DUF5706 domain-containing protein [Priestia megaterium]
MQDNLEKIYAENKEWLKFAEAKNGVFLTLNGALIFGLFGLKVGKKSQLIEWLFWQKYIGCSLLILSSLVLLVSFLPKLKENVDLTINNQQKPLSHINFWYYRHTYKYSPKSFLDDIYTKYSNTINPNKGIELDLAYEIVILARIAYWKYILFSISLWLTVSAIILPSLFVLIGSIF